MQLAHAFRFGVHTCVNGGTRRQEVKCTVIQKARRTGKLHSSVSVARSSEACFVMGIAEEALKDADDKHLGVVPVSVLSVPYS